MSANLYFISKYNFLICNLLHRVRQVWQSAIIHPLHAPDPHVNEDRRMNLKYAMTRPELVLLAGTYD
jgi:hypothetical protein